MTKPVVCQSCTEKERVARAIYCARFSPGYWGGVDDETRSMYLEMAGAAIAEIEQMRRRTALRGRTTKPDMGAT